MGLGKVELGESPSPQHNANPADLLLVVGARWGYSGLEHLS